MGNGWNNPEKLRLPEKIRTKSKKSKKKKVCYGHFTFTWSVEAVLPNVFLKQLQLHQKSRSTEGAKAGAVFSGAGALSNRPL
jgi:hypothetical protein